MKSPLPRLRFLALRTAGAATSSGIIMLDRARVSMQDAGRELCRRFVGLDLRFNQCLCGRL